MLEVILINNIYDNKENRKLYVDNFLLFLTTHYEKFPAHARIYAGEVSIENDITPVDEAGIKALEEIKGRVFIVEYPGDPVTIIVAVVAVAAVTAAAFLLAPSIPTPALKNTPNKQRDSPNNELSQRVNSPRVNGRIPDIFGTVRSTPDLIAVPWTQYENHQEVEIIYGCIGKGYYTVDADKIWDDTTPVNTIDGMSVEIYEPVTNPSTGSPSLTVGTPINEEVYSVTRSNAVNGQTLRAPNDNSFNAEENVRMVSPNIIEGPAGLDFSTIFDPTDTEFVIANGKHYEGPPEVVNSTFKCSAIGVITKTGAPFGSGFVAGGHVIFQPGVYTYTGGTVVLDGEYTVKEVLSATSIQLEDPWLVNEEWFEIEGNFVNDETDFRSGTLIGIPRQTLLNFNGSYTISSISGNLIYLNNPSAVSSSWNDLTTLYLSRTLFFSPILSSIGDRWVGPFVLANIKQILCNFVALNGLYKDNGLQQMEVDVELEVEATPVDEDNQPTGSAQTFTTTIFGSYITKSTRAKTLKSTLSATGRYSIRCKRNTDKDLDYNGTVVDEVKWKDLYGLDLFLGSFGSVTTIMARTIATDGALKIKERKLNLEVTRKVPTRTSGDQFTTALTATKRIDEIISYITLDEKIGAREKEEVDFDSIYDTVQEVEDYFGTEQMVEFSYTFDKENMSYEETLSTLAASIFCTAYRQGNKIRLKFEKATALSVLLFNHRNKLPGTESRTVRFGPQSDYEGVELEYVDPSDDSIAKFFVPDENQTLYKKVETVGIRSKLQAFYHAWRIYNKIVNQNTAIEVDTTQEAELLTLTDRILITDGTRLSSSEGEIVAQDGLAVTLSQKHELTPGQQAYIFLQHTDGTVESLEFLADTDDYTVTLLSAPKQALSVDPDNYARATFLITTTEDFLYERFLLTEKHSNENLTVSIKAVNYDSAYYNNDALLWEGNLAGYAGAYVTPAYAKINIIGDAYDIGNLTAPQHYTKTVFATKNDTGIGNIISSVVNDNETFRVNNNVVEAGHTGVFNNVSFGPLTQGVPYFLAVTYDGTFMRLYVNGELKQTANVAQRTLDTLRVADGWVGSFQNERLYGRALNSEEILRLYNG